MITAIVNGQSMMIKNGVVASDTIDYLEMQVLFVGDDWDGMSVIRAIITNEDTAMTYSIPLTDGRIRKEDHLNLAAGLWKVHLVGSAYEGGELVERITTVQDFLRVAPCGELDGEPLPEIPASDVERLEAAIEELRKNGGGTDKYVSDYRIETIGFPGRSYIVLVYTDGSEMKIELPQMGIDIDDVIQFGTSDPTGNTSGGTKQLYINTNSGKVWVCKNGSMRPTQWISLSGGEDTGGGITKEELSSAVDDALSDAKESGEFDGKDGVTPHIGTNGNWYIGSTDTGVRAKGVDGKDGANGKDGVTPHIGGNGNWFIGESDTGVKAKGVDGKDGTNGKDGKDGKTPVAGTDYFTAADKAELVAAVIAGLPVYDGEAVIM